MAHDSKQILQILDRCCDHFSFPMLDNGYVYLAATRLSLYRSESDWAMVIEVFGFSPRAGLPHTSVYTFASQLCCRDEKFGSQEALELYLANNPNNELRFVHPISEGPWQDEESDEWVSESAEEVKVRGQRVSIPVFTEYGRNGINLEHSPKVQVFELCRYVADVAREQILATPQERRINVLPELKQVLQLEAWHHPNVVVDEERPSGSEAFQQLAQVLVSGNVEAYRPTMSPNTNWVNWPKGGRL
jgi:hypothetical protein